MSGALVDECDAVLLDLDGVLYVGEHAVPGAVAAVTEVRRRGLATAYVTNNASRTPQQVADHLRALGIPAEPGDVVTAAQAVAALIAADVPPGAPVLLVGGDGLRAALQERGLVPVTRLDDGPVAVVQGFAPQVDWSMLAEATYGIRAGLPWYASNLDATLPTPRGPAPGNGALVAAVAAATGQQPVSAGKPEPAIFTETVQRLGARHPLVVGDRLDTDIAGGVAAGIPTLLVLTGVASAADAVLARPGQRPDHLAVDLPTGLLEPRSPVTSDAPGTGACGGWLARAVDGTATVAGSGRRIDGIRALAAAARSAAEPPTRDVVEKVLDALG